MCHRRLPRLHLLHTHTNLAAVYVFSRCRASKKDAEAGFGLQRATSILANAAGRSDIRLVSIKVAGKQLSDSEFTLTDKKLTVPRLPSGSFEVEIETDIKPQVLVSFGLLLYCMGVFITFY